MDGGVRYVYSLSHGCSWTKDGGNWKGVKGLDSLTKMYDGNGGLTGNTTELVSCGGKLLFMWEGYMTRNPSNSNRKQIWCAEITLETHDECEVWGNVEWIDVVQSVPMKFELLRCLVVSLEKGQGSISKRRSTSLKENN
ncbi:hypothetical protein HID58_094455 [Brassica napus]|uniref:FKB95-like N-terminal Kelch domain-containing protein n=1 Tax=Brassica napus TaxID=3708 RepID=A0ABQ7X7A6_BRANA|nr:hypothetical protein HID58_094455 [Brassica napus]